MNEILSHKCEYQVHVKENGKWSLDKEFSNLIMDAYLDELVKTPQGVTPDLEIRFVAIGTGNTTPSITDTALDTEIFRKQVTTKSKTGIGELTTTFVVIDSEAVANWQEIGIFGSSSATSTPGSGVLMSRVLYSRSKTNLEEIAITRKDIFTRS